MIRNCVVPSCPCASRRSSVYTANLEFTISTYDEEIVTEGTSMTDAEASETQSGANDKATPPVDAESPAAAAAVTPAADAAEAQVAGNVETDVNAKTDDGLIPLGPPVFGKFAFFITVIPFVFYLAGMYFADYIETSRAHTRTKKQGDICVEAIGRLDKRLEGDLGSNSPGLQQAKGVLNLVAIHDLLRSEEWEYEKLHDLTEPLKDESIKPEYFQKVELRRQIKVLEKMKELEEEGKLREVLALSHRHFEKLKSGQRGVDESLDQALDDVVTDSATANEWFPPDKTWYPSTYVIIIAGTAILLALAFPGYFKTKFSVSWWGLIVGVVGIVVWIGLVEIDRRFIHLGEYMSPHGRDAFNPLQELKGNPSWMWQFMTIRFAGLVLIVPFIEEFFLRGWLMRYIDDPDWDQIPIGAAGQWAILGVVGYGVLSHVGEPLAAAAWFGMVTWLYLKTKSIWDCVLAHAVTNLLLGIFVVWTGSWYLW